MLALVLVLVAAPAEDLAAKLRHLEVAGSAEAPAPSPDGTRVAFVTTLFGSRQAGSMPIEGGYPTQLTDEPGGVLAVRYSPDAKQLVALVRRGETRRLLLLDDEGGPPAELDAAPGDQLPGGFTRDGHRFVYAVVDGGKVALKQLALDTRKSTEVAPPPPAAGAAAAPLASQPVTEALAGISLLGPPTPDGRSIVAQVRRGDDETLVLVDLGTARGEVLTPHAGRARFRFPRWNSDGRTLYVLTDQGRERMGVDSIVIASKVRKTVYAPPQEVEAYAISEDGHRLAVAAQQEGETIFSLLELPSLRAQPLPQPLGGALGPALAASESPLVWNRSGDKIFFSWRLADDTTDVWMFRMGYGTPMRLTHSPRPGLGRGAIPRPTLARVVGTDGREVVSWLWRPEGTGKPRVAVLVSATPTRPLFDKRIAALNFAGFAVLAVNAPLPEAEQAALKYLRAAPDLDGRKPLLLDFDAAAPVADASEWSGVVVGAEPGRHKGLPTIELTADLERLVAFAREKLK